MFLNLNIDNHVFKPNDDEKFLNLKNSSGVCSSTPEDNVSILWLISSFFMNRIKQNNHENYTEKK